MDPEAEHAGICWCFWLLKKNEVRERHADDTGFTPGQAGAQQCCAPTGLLCGGEEFDFDPAGFAAVEEFVGVDGGS